MKQGRMEEKTITFSTPSGFEHLRCLSATCQAWSWRALLPYHPFRQAATRRGGSHSSFVRKRSFGHDGIVHKNRPFVSPGRDISKSCRCISQIKYLPMLFLMSCKPNFLVLVISTSPSTSSG
jgi:hypothetical protein